MTKGEYRVNIDFNPSKHEGVNQIKRAAANLIDMIEQIAVGGSGSTSEVGRWKALAQTAIEEGAMWAVKAATKKTTSEEVHVKGEEISVEGSPV